MVSGWCCGFQSPAISIAPRNGGRERDRLAAGIQNKPGGLAVDLRIHPEPVIGTDGLHTQTPKQDVNEHSDGSVPGSAGVAAFSSSSRPMLGAAFVKLPSSMSGPTLWR